MINEIPAYAKSLSDGHPVRVYFLENIIIKDLIDALCKISISDDFELYFNLFNQLSEIEKKFARKENQLFPYLEKYGWTGPSQGMWAFHDRIRDQLREIRKAIDVKNWAHIDQQISFLKDELFQLINVEEMRLFPYALELLKPEDWDEMKEGDEEIGWMFDESPYTEEFNKSVIKEEIKTADGMFKLDEGMLNLEQINLLLRFVPVDLTLVDEFDRVRFYNRGESRVFPRSAGVIGREVRFCHPPKSVAQVLLILDEFKAGRKDEAEFWITFKGRFIHIRYFALRNSAGEYKGVIEMSQDITDIKKLEGERRLLDWN